MTNVVKTRGTTVNNPPGTKYSLWSWLKGYAAWIAVLPIYLFLWGYASAFGRIPEWFRKLLLKSWNRTACRKFDVRIPGTAMLPAYMLRWWKIKRNAFFNIYYHHVRRSDDDTALHDHPWWSFSIVLEGGYWEHRIKDGGVHVKTWMAPGSVLFRRSGSQAHRLELDRVGVIPGLTLESHRMEELPVKTIFITGPVLRRWGFHHTDSWVDAYEWDDYLAARGIESMKMKGYAEQLKKED